MDTLRDNFSDRGGEYDTAIEEDADHDAPPLSIGGDERRMQVRAYNFWASLLLDNRKYPDIADLDSSRLGDFGPNGVLLDFSDSNNDPKIGFLGERLADECGVETSELARLSEVPARSLLSRITDHYLQILANQAPIGFEAEFVNQRGATVLYRGILLPFSSDDETIDYIFGAINWKELADARSADELLLEIDQALEKQSSRQSRRLADGPMADWADGPGSLTAIHEETDPGELPRPSFGLDLTSLLEEVSEASTIVHDPAMMELADWLASARELAQAACSAEDRTRKTLYDAVSRAYDFSLAAQDSPEDYCALVAEAGLTKQDRAPMTPVVKLVFGAGYDKTRLTEYAAVLTHAQRMGLPCGALAEYLRQADGGLKGVVQAERDLRRHQSGKPVPQYPSTPRAVLARKLRTLEPRDFSTVPRHGDEFGLVMIRRTETGDVAMLGEVAADRALIEKAARALLG